MNTATENMVGKLLEPVFRMLPLEAARKIVDLEADEQLQQRVEILARKANGALCEWPAMAYTPAAGYGKPSGFWS